MVAEWTTPKSVHSRCGEDAASPASNAIDKSTGTWWKHAAFDWHWIIFDMGSSKKITKIRLYQYIDAFFRWGLADGLYVSVSDDPTDFGYPVWEGVLNAEGWQESAIFSKNGRYIKPETKSNSADQIMCEFEAMAEAVAPPPTHTLNVNSSPITGIPVTINDQPTRNTPVSVAVEEGEHSLQVPEEIQT